MTSLSCGGWLRNSQTDHSSLASLFRRNGHLNLVRVDPLMRRFVVLALSDNGVDCHHQGTGQPRHYPACVRAIPHCDRTPPSTSVASPFHGRDYLPRLVSHTPRQEPTLGFGK